MSESNVLGADGKPVQKIPCLNVFGKTWPIRLVDRANIFKEPDPRKVFSAFRAEQSDINNLFWLGFAAVGKDLVEGNGGKYTQEFVEAMGLELTDLTGQKLNILNWIKESVKPASSDSN